MNRDLCEYSVRILSRVVCSECDYPPKRCRVEQQGKLAVELAAEVARLTRDLAQARAEVAVLMKALDDAVGTWRDGDLDAPEDPEIHGLCERLGYGAVIDSAARQWARKDPIGAHTHGPCRVFVLRARSALATPSPLADAMADVVKAADAWNAARQVWGDRTGSYLAWRDAEDVLQEAVRRYREVRDG